MLETRNKRVLIAMSGGVDSAVAAYLLKEQGYDCIGCTLVLHNHPAGGVNTDAEDAKSIAEKLGIPHIVLDCSQLFDRQVVQRFTEGYINGVTPNPCIDCNRHIKFGALWRQAETVGAQFLATGHYAQTQYDTARSTTLLKKAVSTEKDQSYVLYAIPRDVLPHVLFPLGGLRKDEVRGIARAQGFAVADKRESQDICFVPDGDHAAFIEQYTGKTPASGDFIDTDGQVLGKHRGIYRYTVGQRKGLGIVMHRPVYVLAKDAAPNTVTLGSDEELHIRTFEADGFNWLARKPEDGAFNAQVKIRYRHTPSRAVVTPLKSARVRVDFDEPQRAVAAGQAAVVYDGEQVVGGGTIC